MIAFLSGKTSDGRFNYETLDDGVKNYLESDGKLDETRLFDFANRMSGLFLDYEVSRPSQFIYESGECVSTVGGILDAWQEGDLKDFFVKNGEVAENEKWQRKLYSRLFHNAGENSFLTRAFEASNARTGAGLSYLTLPYLYKSCLDSQGKALFHYESDTPLFIFGLSGMGLFYRVILEKFAETHEVYAYIQNPCMAFWEDIETGRRMQREKIVASMDSLSDSGEQNLDKDENALLSAWGKSGRESIKLWNQMAHYNDEGFAEGDILDDGDLQGLPHDTLLHQVQWMVANRTNAFSGDFNICANENEPFFANDKSLSVTAAPNRIREVEALHSHICQLLQNGVCINEILVVSPNLDDYRTAIYQVFDQTENDHSENTIHLRFSIVDSSAKESLTANALKILFDIREKHSISRPDFFALVRNPVVQNTRRISPDEISDWEGWVSSLNVFRDRDVKADWLDGVRRLLLSRFSSKVVSVGSQEFLPYSDMASANDSSLLRFVDAIDSLENWILKSGNNGVVKESDGKSFDLDQVVGFLDSWLSMPNPPDGFGGETVIYRNVAQAAENLRYQFDAGMDSLSWKIISQTLLASAKGSEYSCGNLFVNGITFMKFAPNRTIPVKHLFFMGACARNFPGNVPSGALDLRKAVAAWPGDDSPVDKNRYAFLSQLMSTGEGFHLSYVCKNLQKDEELYPSSVINDLRLFLKEALRNYLAAEPDCKNDILKNVLPDIEIPIDETRPNTELFTGRERRNKLIYENFGKAVESNVVSYAAKEAQQPERVTVYSLRKFLEDPFQFQVGQMMKLDENGDDPEKTAFESITLSRLESSRLLKKIVALELGIGASGESEDEIRRMTELRGELPDGEFGEQAWEKLKNEANALVEQILAKFPADSFDFTEREISLQIENRNEPSKLWTLSGNIPILAHSKDCDSVFHIIEIVSKNSLGKSLSPYLAAVALKAETGTDVDFFLFCDKESKNILISQTKGSAINLLQKIYEKAYIQKYAEILPLDLFDLKKDKLNSIDDLKYNLSQTSWKYFAEKDLFDLDDLLSKKIGGEKSKGDFRSKWDNEKKAQWELIPDLKIWLENSANEESEETDND